MSEYPLIKFTIAFIFGIVLTSIFKFSIPLLLLLLAIFILVAQLKYVWKSNVVELLSTWMVFGAIAMSGMIYFNAFTIDKSSYPFRDNFISGLLLDGRVEEIELPSKKLTLKLNVETTVKGNQKVKRNFKVLVNLNYEEAELNEILNKLRPGNRIVVLGNLTIPPNQRNPGEFNYREYLSSEGVIAILNSHSPLDFVIIDYDENVLKSTIFSIRYSIANSLKEIYSANTVGLLKGLLLADRSEIGYDIKEGFVKSGVIHVLAVSGLHVGFIILILLFILGRFNIYVRITFTILGLFIFMVVTGLPPSVTRASVMASLLLISILRSNKQNNYNTLALAALIILVFDPTQVFNPGFQLSFSAVLSIFIFFPRFRNFIDNNMHVNKTVRFFLLFISVSLAAQIGTVPFTIYYFQKLSLLSVISNIYIIPVIGAILGLGILTLFVNLIYTPLAGLFILFNEALIEFTYYLIDQISLLPFSHVEFPNFSIWDGIVYFSLLILLTIFFKRIFSLIAKLIFIFLIVLNLVVWTKIDNQKLLPDGYLSVMFVDVGHSEAAIIKFQDNKHAMINFGSATLNYSAGKYTLIPLLKKLEIDKIDYGIISHFNRQKYLGVLELIEHNFIDKLYIPKISSENRESDLFLSYLENKSINYKFIENEKNTLSNSRLYFLTLPYDSEDSYLSVFNNSCLVKLNYGYTDLLFMGGIEKRGEELITNVYKNFLKSDILHLANYGSDVSTSQQLISSVKPTYSIVSVGLGNFMNYPSEQTVNQIIDLNSQLFRTDEDGAILFISDGKRFRRVNWRSN